MIKLKIHIDSIISLSSLVFFAKGVVWFSHGTIGALWKSRIVGGSCLCLVTSIDHLKVGIEALLAL